MILRRHSPLRDRLDILVTVICAWPLPAFLAVFAARAVQTREWDVALIFAGVAAFLVGVFAWARPWVYGLDRVGQWLLKREGKL